MSNFTESQILILTLIAISNVVLLIVAFVLLFSGRKNKSIDIRPQIEPVKQPDKIPAPKPEPGRIEEKKIVEHVPERVPERPEKIVPIEPKRPKEVQPEIDYNNYKIDEYSDEEYKYNSIEEFENQQEENAIISYKELMKLKDNYEEPIEVMEKPKPTYNNTNYGSDEFISPVFGRVKNDYEYSKPTPKRVEREPEKRYNNAPVREVAKEVNSNIEFLNALKEFRNNL